MRESDDAHAIAVSGPIESTPPSCACCGEVAASSLLERHGVRSIIVPYCTPCQRHASAETTRALAVALASVLLGTTLALALPSSWPVLPAWAYVSLVAAGAIAPLFGALLGMRRAVGCASAGRAVRFTRGGNLHCASGRWARELAASHAFEARPTAALRWPRSWMLAGLPVGLIVAFAAWPLLRPTVRIVNLALVGLTMKVDGVSVATLTPTSGESPSAGANTRLTAGDHSVEAVDANGDVVARDQIRVVPGRSHLYAPGDHGHCFWVERTAYGKSKESADLEIDVLDPTVRFWTLPRPIDSWFAPNPAPGSAGPRATGGSLTALRHAPCEVAPAAVRREWARHRPSP